MKCSNYKKETMFCTIKNIWYTVRWALLIECILLGIATGLFFLGNGKSATLFRISLWLYISCGGFLFYILLILFIALFRTMKLFSIQQPIVEFLENGRIQIKMNGRIIDAEASQIVWTREDKTYMSVAIKVGRKRYSFSLKKDLPEHIYKLLKSRQKNKGLTPPRLFCLASLAFLVFGFAIMSPQRRGSIDTEDESIYFMLQQHSPIEMLTKLYPLEEIKRQPISKHYYYEVQEHFVFPINEPEIAVLYFKYDAQTFDIVKEEIEENVTTQDWSRTYGGTIFYKHPNFKDEDNYYGFIGYNNSSRQVILLGYKEEYVSYSKWIDQEFDVFISKVFGRNYPRS